MNIAIPQENVSALNTSANNKIRNSNLELYRIIAMLLIIAHHYVVNSGLFREISNDPMIATSIYLYLFGMWGKIGINCFVLITGYFMCKSEITSRKFLKLWIEVVFYTLIIYILFVFSGYQTFTLKGLFFTFIPIKEVKDDFVSCFFLFYLFIPFLNVLVRNIDKRLHGYLIILCLFTYTFLATFIAVSMNYVIWFSIIYIIASYIRFYPVRYGSKFWGLATFLSVIISCLSVLACIHFNRFPYAFVSDSNAIMAVITSICSFMFFKNIQIKYNKWINLMGASTFGVLLIHANSDMMRQWLWVDTLKNVQVYYTSNVYIHSIISIFAIFFICSILDQIRLHLIEKPLFKKLDN